MTPDERNLAERFALEMSKKDTEIQKLKDEVEHYRRKLWELENNL